MAKAKRTDITQEHVEAACQMMAGGKSLRAACRELGLAESSVRYHLNKDAESFAQSARARELGCDALADECLEIADNSTLDPQDRRIRIDTRIRLIGKWSQRYSDKLTVQNNTTVTHRYDLDSLTADELDALETIARKAAVIAGDTGSESASEPAKLH
jgi:hypothetical protein